MKWLTYGQQMVLGILFITISHILSWVTGWRYFENLGWIAYGLLFLIHPVWGVGAANTPTIKTCVRLAGAVVVLIGCFLRVGDGADYWQNHISESLGIDVSEGVVLNSFDDHSGFQGEGTSYVVLVFADEKLKQEISASGGWKKLPLSASLETLIYGTKTENKAAGPFIGITFPKVEEGYWYFYDQQGQTQDDSAVLNRNSYNYTFSLYDVRNDCLYYCEYDT